MASWRSLSNSPRQRAVRAIFLDVGGVFHLPSHEHVLGALARADAGAGPDPYRPDPGRLDRAHYAGVHALTTWPEGESAIWTTYLEAYAVAAGVPAGRLDAAVAALEEAFRGPDIWSRRAPGSLEGLRALAATGIALAIVSNSDGTVERRLAAEGICQVGPGAGVSVRVVVDSAAVGVAKPDPAIFRVALEATGVDPAQAVHVGDAVGADVVGALAAGVRPVHLDPYGFCADRSHAHLARLTDLVAWVTNDPDNQADRPEPP